MKAIIQRVNSCSLSADGKPKSKIGKGLLVLLGVSQTDTEDDAKFIAKKIPLMRIFEDENEKLNLSVQDIKGEVLVVSNFTLYGDAQKGNRPSFSFAAAGDKAEKLYDLTCSLILDQVSTQTGVFGADMQISASLDGPVTIELNS